MILISKMQVNRVDGVVIFLIAYICVILWILLWATCHILPLLGELHETFNMCSFYICVSDDFIFFLIPFKTFHVEKKIKLFIWERTGWWCGDIEHEEIKMRWVPNLYVHCFVEFTQQSYTFGYCFFFFLNQGPIFVMLTRIMFMRMIGHVMGWILLSQSSYVEVLTTHTSEWDLIWR